MSRAFVRESDDRPELPSAPPASSLPAGAKNYITERGAARLAAELQRLRQEERPSHVAGGDDLEAKRKLAVLDQRLASLEQSLQSAEVVPLAAADIGVVRFGATVTVRRADGEEDQYRIVGVDEIDLDRGWVSWLSPIARALLNATAHQRVRFRFPSGEEELEIVKIEYEDA